MARFVRIGLLAAIALCVAAAAFANIPNPALSQVPDAITIAPDGSIGYNVTVNGSQGPVVGAQVQLRFTAQSDGLICWCSGQVHPTISAITNGAGQVTFFVAGGGCVEEGETTNPTVCQVFADGVELKQIFVNSPDVQNSQGQKVTDTGYVSDGVCEVGAGDAVYHTGPIVNATVDFCSNFTGPNFDDAVQLGDAIILTPFVIAGTSCVE